LQIGKKLKQLAVVLLIEIHVDSTLFTVRKTSTKNREQTTQLSLIL
jgi:hypothetical protein